MRIIFLLIVVCSCTKNEVSDTDVTQRKTEQSAIKFMYQGEEYSSEISFTQDSTLIIENPQVDAVYKRLMNNPDLATVVYDNGTIEYYDDYESSAKMDNIGDQSETLPIQRKQISAVFKIFIVHHQIRYGMHPIEERYM